MSGASRHRHRLLEVVTMAGPVTLIQGGRIIARVVQDSTTRRYIDLSKGDVWADTECALFFTDHPPIYPKVKWMWSRDEAGERWGREATSSELLALAKQGRRMKKKSGKKKY